MDGAVEKCQHVWFNNTDEGEHYWSEYRKCGRTTNTMIPFITDKTLLSEA